jgi:multimeric flavodoxin WrbA
MKKVLTIIGSPRRGNSYAAALEVEKVLSAGGAMEMEYVFLSEMNVEMCRGCFACLKTGIEKCPIHDDVGVILEKINTADAVVFVSPVYVMSVSGLMKNFFDRLCSICHRPVFCRKYAMVLSTVGAVGLKDTLKYMAGAVGSWQFRKVVKLGLKTPLSHDHKGNMTPGNLDRIRKRSIKLREMVLHDRHARPGLSQVIQFRIQRAIFTGKAASDWPADGRFYSALRDRKYFCDTRVNPLVNAIGALVEMTVRLLLPGGSEDRKERT